MKAYLDDYNLITLMVEKSKLNLINMFTLKCDKLTEELQILNTKEYNEYLIYSLSYKMNLKFWRKSYIIVGDDYVELYSGSIIRTNRFDEEFYYNGKLGITYSRFNTIFRIWSPVAKEIILVLNHKRHSLSYVDKGLWELDLKGDFEGYKYYYIVYINGHYKKVLDPYGYASDTNGYNNYVIDQTKYERFKYQKPEFSGNYCDASIYEVSVRDFSYNSSAKSKYRGKFLGLCENHPTSIGLPTGLEYIAYLGFSHVQLMPVFDFEGIDDTSNKKYNWGYNPHQYFTLCGWFSTNPEDPYSRINEFIKLVDEAHKRGLRINLDVVFNHVFDYRAFPLDSLVPGYFFRVGLDGNMTEVTGCQNDFASEKRMARKFIVDNLVYYASVFKIDGFRFDLMGLLDIPTMNLINQTLRAIDNNIMLYGEGWNMNNTIPNEMRPHMYNNAKIPEYAFFNDTFRDFIRGNQWENTLGFAISENMNAATLFNLFCGSSLPNFKFLSPSQSINYVECHDNYTFYDFIKKNTNYDDEKIKDKARLVLGLICLSLGIPFIHSGQEFLRTKDGIENSYNKGDIINRFDYELRDKNIDLVNTLKDLLSLRKELKNLRLNNVYDIINKVKLLSDINSSNSCVIKIEDLVIIIKNSYQDEYFNNDRGYITIFNGVNKCNELYKEFYLNKPGVYVYKKEV